MNETEITKLIQQTAVVVAEEIAKRLPPCSGGCNDKECLERCGLIRREHGAQHADWKEFYTEWKLKERERKIDDAAKLTEAVASVTGFKPMVSSAAKIVIYGLAAALIFLEGVRLLGGKLVSFFPPGNSAP